VNRSVCLKRPAAGLIGWVLIVLVLGGCQRDPEIDLTIKVTAREESTYTLRCDPSGGDLPRAAAVCAAIAHHRDLFLNPPRARSTCVGGVFVPPSISIEGRYRGADVAVGGRSCDWPSGLGLAVIETAVGHGNLDRAVARLRCGENPRLLVARTPWRQVRACLNDPVGWGR
jgi:Subtilisin inhibitor-like